MNERALRKVLGRIARKQVVVIPPGPRSRRIVTCLYSERRMGVSGLRRAVIFFASRCLKILTFKAASEGEMSRKMMESTRIGNPQRWVQLRPTHQGAAC